MQGEVAERSVEFSAGGGMVTVVAKGDISVEGRSGVDIQGAPSDFARTLCGLCRSAKCESGSANTCFAV